MAAPSPSPSPSKVVSLKLVIDKKARKVLFAEAGKETVDFLCSILTLPVGTVVRLLSKQGMVGCLSNLYQSIESLKDDYIQPNQKKDSVLKPMASTSFLSNSLVHQSLTHAPQTDKKLYRCAYNYSHIYVTNKSGSPCPSCKHPMHSEAILVEEGNRNAAGEVAGGGGVSGGGGFVKGVVTYMVMDDLVVVPLSTSKLLNMFDASNVNALEEKVVDLDLDKGLKVLKMAFQSKEVLTSVFLLQDEAPSITRQKKRRG